ncbi:MAG: hypothetical protein AABZ41_03655 [Bacteroidota bacterium]
MERYLVISPHTAEDCAKAIKQIESVGSLTRFDWGCKDGEHTGWVIVEADSKAEALMVVPSVERPHAKIVKLVKFSPSEVKAMHPTTR